MAGEDETAKTSLIYDASGAKEGAAEFVDASEKIIAAEAAVGASADKTAATVTAASATMADVIGNATKRIATDTSSTSAWLNRLTTQFDPLGSAVVKASKSLDDLMDVVTRGGPNAARALSLIPDATDLLNAKLVDSVAGVKNFNDAVGVWTEKFSPAQASVQKMVAEIADLNAATKAGVEIQGGYANAFDNIVAKYDEGAQAAKRLNEQQQQLIVTAREAQNVQNAQTNFNSVLGVNPGSGAGSASASAAVFQENFDQMAQQAKTIEALTQEFSPLTIATAEYQAVLARVNQALSLGIIGEQEADKARKNADATLANLTRQVNTHTASTGQADFATRQLGVQTIQFFTSIEAGQPILTAFIQQFHQVVDVSVATGTTVGQMGTQIGKAFNSALAWATSHPIVVGITLVTGALVALGVASESAARQSETLQNQLRATRTDYAALSQEVILAAKDIAGTTNIGTSEALSAGQTIAASPNFEGTQKQLEALIVTSANLGRVMGVTTAEAAKTLAAALQNPGSVAQKLATADFPGMDQALANNIKLMADGGDKADAFAKVLAVIQANTNGVANVQTPLQQAFTHLSEAFTRTGQDGRSFANVLGDAITGAAAIVINSIASIISGLQKLRDLASLSGGQLPGAAIAATPGVPVVGPSTTIPRDIQNLIYNLAEQKNFAGNMDLSALQADFATKIAQIESGGRQFNPQGGVLTSSAGAMGVMQLMPQTASGLGVSPTDTTENVTGGLKYIAQLWANPKFGGDPRLVAMAYNWGPENAAAFVDGVKTLGQVPSETSDFVFKVTGSGIPQPRLGPSLPGVSIAGGSGAAVGAGNNTSVNDAFQATQTMNLLIDLRAKNAELQKQMQTALTGAQNSGNTADIERYTQGLANAKGAATGLITVQEQMAESALKATIPLAAQQGMTRDLAEIDAKYEEAARKSGVAVDQQAVATEKLAKLSTLSTQFNDMIQTTNQNTDAQVKIAAAVDGTAQSLYHAQNQAQAYQEALIKFKPGSDELNAAVVTRTAALDAQSAATLKATQSNDALAKTIPAQIQANQQLQQVLQSQLDTAKSSGNTDLVNLYSKALETAKGAATDLIDAQQKLARASEDAVKPLAAQSGFERDMAQIEQQFAEASRQSGQAINQQALAQAKLNEQKKLATSFNDQITATEQQTSAQLRINAAYDGTTESLTHAQNAEKAYAQAQLDFPRDSDARTAAILRYTNALDAGSAATQSLQQRQQALQDLSGAFTQAFDQIGQAITNSLLQGTGAAVNWGNVMKAVAQQVLQEFLKLAVLNPLLNNLFGQHNTTFSSALGALGSLGGSSGAGSSALGVAGLAANANSTVGGGSGSSLLSEGGSLLSIGKALFPDTFSSGGSMFSGLGESLGLTGPNGTLSSITNLLNTPLLGTGALTSATTNALSGLGTGVYGPATAGQVGIAGSTVGSVLGGVGAGYGVGSLVGGYVQDALGKTGPGPEIGAGIGSAALVAGAALAPETFGISLLLAGLIGGTAGGALGGLIGPKPASPFSSTTVASGLQEGSTVSQLTDTSQEVAKLNAQLADISAFLNQSGLAEIQPRTIQVGQNSPKGPDDNSKFSDLYTPNASGHAAFSEFQFTSQNSDVNQLVSSRSYPDLQTLESVFTATNQFVQNVSSVQGFDIGKFLSGFQDVDSSALPAKFAAVTDFLTKVLPTLSDLNLQTNISTNDAANFVSQFNSLSDAFSGLRFASGNGDINNLIKDRSFADQNTLTTVVTALNQFVTDVAGSGFDVSKYLASLGGVANSDLPTVLSAVDQFVTKTVPALLDFNKVTGSLNDAISQINTQFDLSIQTAHALGYQEQELTAARDKAIETARNTARHSADLQTDTLNAQTLTVKASLSGSSKDAETAALTTFDVQRQQQIEQLQNQYKSIFGDAYATTTEYVENSTALENLLGVQRLAIQKQYNDQITLVIKEATAEQLRQIADQIKGYQNQYLSAYAQITGTPTDAMTAALANFDAQAAQQTIQLAAQFKGIFGDLFAETSQYYDAITGRETSLGEQRLAIQKQYNDQIVQAQRQAADEIQGFQGQYLTAHAQITGNPADAQTAALFNFDLSAQQQRAKLVSEYQGIYGSAYAFTSQYVQASTGLEKSLGEQRLAIQKQYGDQIAQTAQQQQDQAAQAVTGVITSLKAYALSLQQGSASPLSLKDQYSLASSQFNAVSGAATAGDFNSLQQLQTYAQALQEASRAVNGSGAQYATDIARIESVLSQVATTPVGTLTSEAFTAQMKTTTQTLSGDLGDLKTLLSEMLGVLKQSKFAPAKFSAAA